MVESFERGLISLIHKFFPVQTAQSDRLYSSDFMQTLQTDF